MEHRFGPRKMMMIWMMFVASFKDFIHGFHGVYPATFLMNENNICFHTSGTVFFPSRQASSAGSKSRVRLLLIKSNGGMLQRRSSPHRSYTSLFDLMLRLGMDDLNLSNDWKIID